MHGEVWCANMSYFLVGLILTQFANNENMKLKYMSLCMERSGMGVIDD